MLGDLKVNKVVFIESGGDRYAWYLTIVFIGGKPNCFWSNHKCSGMGNAPASRAFEREHFKEVSELVAQKLRNEYLHSNQN